MTDSPAAPHLHAPEPVPPTGRFAWHDLMTEEPEKAQTFYTSLFAWDARTVDLGEEGTYTMLIRGERSFGGILPLAPGQGIPAHWLGYVTVDSMSRAVERAQATGGTIAVPDREIPDTGRFSVVVDPEGAAIALFERDAPSEGAPATFVWNQLLTGHPVSVGPFYRDVFHWSMRQKQAGELGTHWVFYRGDEEIAGVLQMPVGAAAPSFWLPYVGIDDVDAAAARAEELGAGIHVPPTDIPDMGRYAVLADPTGAAFALFRPVEVQG